MTDSPEAKTAAVTLTTAQLEQIVAEWMAHWAGVDMPVKHTARWGWVPDQGPVLIRMEIEAAPNVVPLRKGQSGG